MSGYTGIVLFDDKLEKTLTSFEFPKDLRGFYEKSDAINNKRFRIVSYVL